MTSADPNTAAAIKSCLRIYAEPVRFSIRYQGPEDCGEFCVSVRNARYQLWLQADYKANRMRSRITDYASR